MQGQPTTPAPDTIKVPDGPRRTLGLVLAAVTFAVSCITSATASNYRIDGGQVLIGPSTPGVSTNRTDYAVGSTPGTFSADQGTASYSIPIPVPPGVAGMQPGLALHYSSQSGNGPVGSGFSLSGLSQIARCQRTVVQDGTRGTVAYDANDRYCLDGQRLIAISGTDGAAGTEYRTEIDGFSRIISYGSSGSGPASFKVWTKGGQVIDYGTE